MIKYYNIVMCMLLWMLGSISWGFIVTMISGGAGWGVFAAIVSMILFVGPTSSIILGYLDSERNE